MEDCCLIMDLVDSDVCVNERNEHLPYACLLVRIERSAAVH